MKPFFTDEDVGMVFNQPVTLPESPFFTKPVPMISLTLANAKVAALLERAIPNSGTLVPTDKLKEMQARLAAAEEALVAIKASWKDYLIVRPNLVPFVTERSEKALMKVHDAIDAYFEKYRDKP
jgi:hypothetical protein